MVKNKSSNKRPPNRGIKETTPPFPSNVTEDSMDQSVNEGLKKSGKFWTTFKDRFSPIKEQVGKLSNLLNGKAASKVSKEELQKIKDGIAHIDLSLSAILKSIDEMEQIETNDRLKKIEAELKRLKTDQSSIKEEVEKWSRSHTTLEQKIEQRSEPIKTSPPIYVQQQRSVEDKIPDKRRRLEFSNHSIQYYTGEPQGGVFSDFSENYKSGLTIYMIRISRDNNLGSLQLVDDRSERVRLFRNVHANLRQTCNLYGIGEPTPENINEDYGIVRRNSDSWILEEKINLKW